MPQNPQSRSEQIPNYTFPGLGSVQGLRSPDNSRYATEQEAREWLTRKRMEHIEGTTGTLERETGQYPMKDIGTVGGFVNRAGGLMESILPAEVLSDPSSALAHSGLNPANVVVNLARSEKKLGGQMAQHTRDIFTKGATPGERAASTGKALVSVLAMLDPFATQTVADVNELQEQGKPGEATGAGLFDILTLLPGSGLTERILGGNAPRKYSLQEARLNRALGPDVSPEALHKVIKDINEVGRRQNRPRTVEGVKDLTTDLKKRLDTEFNLLLQPYRNNRILPDAIANKLIAESNKPNLLMTPEGRAELTKLRRTAIYYQTPWTLDALNEERMRMSARQQAMKERSIEKQGRAQRGDIDEKIDAIVEQGLKDVVYDNLQRLYPNIDVRSLKMRQSVLMSMESAIKDRVTDLETGQQIRRGSGPLEKANVSVYGHPTRGSGGSSVHGLQRLIPGGGPEAVANRAVRKAFPSTPRKVARVVGKATGRSLQLAPKDRERALKAQLILARKVGSKEWEQRILNVMRNEGFLKRKEAQ